jgi:EpsI family protein
MASSALTQRLLMVVALLAIGAFCVVNAGRRDGTDTGARLELVPETLGVWQRVEDMHFDPRVEEILGTRDIMGRTYRGPEGRLLRMVVVHAVNNRSAFHPPEYCLRGSGYELASKRTAACPLQGYPRFAVNEMLFTDAREGERTSGESRRKLLVWNWYMAGTRCDSSFFRQQAALVIGQLLVRSGRGTVVNIYTDVSGGDERAAAQANADFSAALLPALERLM